MADMERSGRSSDALDTARVRHVVFLLGFVMRGKEVAVVDRDITAGCSARYC